MLSEGLQLGRYRLLRLIGHGGAGNVYLAEDQRIKRQVALKIVQSETANSEAIKEAMALFQREAQTIAVLSHPNILPLFDFGEEMVDGMTVTYLVTPFCPERSLSAWLRQRHGTLMLPPHEVTHIIQQAADALEYAHDNQVIHRDVKPSNFLVRSRKDTPDRPDLLLADFGIARLSQANLNMSRTIRGTPMYMAPEQWSGNPLPASDQYALAIMTYELLTGHLPFQGTQEQMMYQHLMAQPRPPSAVNPHLPSAIDAVILRAMAKQPEARFPSISDFARAFQRAVAETVSLPSPMPMPSIASSIPYDATVLSSPLPLSASSPVKDTPHISIPSAVQSNDFYTTLTISTTEALAGVIRTLTLPGNQHVKIAVPAGAHNGQVLHLERQLEASSPYNPKGNLIVTISVASSMEAAVIESIPDLPPVRINWKRLFLFGFALLILIAGITSFSFFGSTRHVPNPGSGSPSILQASPTSGVATAQTTATAQFNATAPVTANLYNTDMQTLVRNEALNKNSSFAWDEVSGSCVFEAGAYHVINMPQNTSIQICLAHRTNFGDLTFQVQMNLLKGSSGGILLRATDTVAYYFRIGQDGKYALLVCTMTGTSCDKTLTSGFSSYIAIGPNQTNVIAVVAKGSRIDLYVNNSYIDEVNDSSSLRGHIGVVADAGSDVVFRNIKVWTS